jgi:DNA-binding CsgD family transcriptional regulator
VLVTGEVGIGKTRLWTERVAAAQRRGWTVLQCRPVESEAPLAYAALGDLLRDVADADFAGLPAPQRRALDVALLRAEPDDRHPLPQAAAVGLLGVLSALSTRHPTIVAIDDVQWLDVESERALVFAARRVSDQRLGFLITRRTDAFASVPGDASLDATLLHTLPERQRAHVDLRLLDASELGQLLHVHLGVQVSRRTLTRLYETSRGNPYFAIEIGRAMLQRGVLDDVGADVPIPPNLQELASGRLAQLPVDTMRIVQLVAATTRPTVSVVDAAFEGEDVGHHLRVASDAGIVEVTGERITFTHPLLASVAYLRATPRERRSIHERLANVLDDPEERGRHLALAVDEPSVAVAGALDDAANRARQRGAPDAAASLLEHARRLTPSSDHDRAQQRGIEAAERHYEAGDVGRARAVLDEVLAFARSGHERARALARLGWVRSQIEGFGAGAQAFRAALGELTDDGDDPPLRIEIEQGLAWCLHSTLGLAPALPHAHASLRHAEQLGDRSLLAGALSYVALLDSVSGEGIATATIDRAISLGHCPSWSQILGRPDWIQALLLAWDDRLEDARGRFIELLDEAREHGDEHALPVVYFQLARTELLLGLWDDAEAHARDCLESTVRSGQAGQRPYALTIGALVHAHRGVVDDARAEIDEGRRIADTLGTVPAGLEIRAAQGFLEVSLGEHELAARTFDELADDVVRFGFREPSMFRFHGDAIEALLASGHIDDARRLLADFDRVGRSLGRASVAMVADRAHGLLAATEGDFEGAYLAFERSLGSRAPAQPFERARTLLALGTVQRRDRKRGAARASLTAASDAFAQLGAPLWLRKAQSELERTGGAAVDDAGLTATEGRIALLIAAGRTYREAADELFISPKTVQWNLSKIYRKLGIRSRAQLAAHFREHGIRSPMGDD